MGLADWIIETQGGKRDVQLWFIINSEEEMQESLDRFNEG